MKKLGRKEKKRAKAQAGRHGFSAQTVLTLAQRAGYRCSVPNCPALTIGPKVNGAGVFNTGTAAHIISASPNSGPRCNPGATEEERKSIENGIHCCAFHGRLIDSDESAYPVEMLKQWKRDHEEQIRLQATQGLSSKGGLTAITVENVGRFGTAQTIRFGKKTLILGENATGKKCLCDIAASIGNTEFVKKWRGPKHLNQPGRMVIEAFSGTKSTWEIQFTDKTTCKIDGTPIPTIFSGFRVLRYIQQTELRQVNRSDYGDMEDKAADDTWQKDADAALIADLAKATNLGSDELLTALKIMELSPGRFFGNIRVEGQTLMCRPSGREHYFRFGSLGGAEQQLVLLDLYIRIAEYWSRTTPTILILSQHAFASMDENNLSKVCQRLGEIDLQCQLIVPLYKWPENINSDKWAIRHLKETGDPTSAVSIQDGLPSPKANKE